MSGTRLVGLALVVVIGGMTPVAVSQALSCMEVHERFDMTPTDAGADLLPSGPREGWIRSDLGEQVHRTSCDEKGGLTMKVDGVFLNDVETEPKVVLCFELAD